MPTQTTTGHRIELSRSQRGLSVQQLAHRVGVKPATVRNWENDRSAPRANKLLMLAGILQIPLSWLLTGDTPLESSRYTPDAELAGIAQKLDRAKAIQKNLAALLIEASAETSRLRRALDEERARAA